MSETTRTAEDVKVKANNPGREPQTQDKDENDPYCCTPGDGGTGADTKP